MLEGMAESIGMVTAFASAIIVTHQNEIKTILARYQRKEARHRPAVVAVAAAPEYQGRHRFDETKPWESRVFDEDKKEVGRVRSEGTKAGRAGASRHIPRREACAPAASERRDVRAPGRLRAPAGQARQRFARASAHSEKLMALR